MNTKNSKTTESEKIRLYFTNKLDLRGNKKISLANLSIYYTGKISKMSIKTINLKSLLQPGIKILIYQMDHIQ